MIGNDVVDLTFASIGHRWKEQRFMDKVFSIDEQNLIADADNQFQTIWLLWTMKESAYKIHVQQYSKHFFVPTKITGQLHSKTEGSVEICNDIYHTSSNITKDYIYTIACKENSKNVTGGCFKIKDASYTTQRRESYRSVLRTFSKLSNSCIEALEIRKNKFGVPEIFWNHRKQLIPFSITHHGHYYGCAMLDNFV